MLLREPDFADVDVDVAVVGVRVTVQHRLDPDPARPDRRRGQPQPVLRGDPPSRLRGRRVGRDEEVRRPADLVVALPQGAWTSSWWTGFRKPLLTVNCRPYWRSVS